MTEQNTEVNSPTPKRNNTTIYIAIIAVLLGLNIFLFVSRSRISSQRDEARSALDTLTTDRDAIKTEYDAALARLDLLVGKNAQLDSIVSNQNSELSRLRNEIQNILSNSRATAADYSRARKLVGQLNSKVKTYAERIAELEADNTRLNKYNAVLVEERDSTVTTNIALSQKVRLASVLHASNIRMVPIDLRRGGKREKETSKASRVDIFRITFDIDENRIAEDGVKELFIRILSPNGNLLSNAAYGSGVSETYDGQTLNYTLAKQISLKQGESVKDVVVDWHQDSNYERGDYKIEIFNEGYKIGSGSINLK